MKITYVINENFCKGTLQIALTTDGNQIIHNISLGYENCSNNLYDIAEKYIESYYATGTQTDKIFEKRTIISLLEQFDSIREFCKQKVPSTGKLVMEDEFETLYCELKKICS